MSRLDLSEFGYEEFTKTVFDHEASEDVSVEPWYSDIEIDVSLPAQLIGNCTRLWEDFPRTTGPYTPLQINQGLWLLLGGSVWIGRLLAERSIPLEVRTHCIQSMYFVFADYVSPSKLDVMPNVFYMWWKLVITARPVVDDGAFDPGKDHLQTREAILRTLKRILALPDKRVQRYALHGLAYLVHPEVPSVVQRWLEANSAALTREETAWVRMVRDGEFRSAG